MCREYKLTCLNWCCLLLVLLPCSMVNLIWFADEKMFIVSALSNMEAWNQASLELETQPSRKLCVLVHCLAGSCNQKQKSSYPQKCVKAIVLGDFCGCNGKTSTIYQRNRWSSPSEQGSNWQHQLRRAGLYSRYIITSVLHHDLQTITGWTVVQALC